MGGIPNPDSYKGYGGGLFLLEAQDSEPDPRLKIISLDYDEDAQSATIRWDSIPGSTYVVEASTVKEPNANLKIVRVNPEFSQFVRRYRFQNLILIGITWA